MNDKLYSAVEAAQELATRKRVGNEGTPYSRVTIAWQARKHGIGQKVANRWVFTAQEIDRLFDLPGGRSPQKQEESPPGESPNPAAEPSPAPTTDV